MKKLFISFFVVLFASWGHVLNSQDDEFCTVIDPDGLLDQPFPNSSNLSTDGCLKYFKLNFIFITKDDGTGSYYDETNDFTGFNDPDYGAYDFVDDLIYGLNYYLENNPAMNICNGYLYYTNPNSDFYDPTFVAPPPGPSNTTRFYSNGIRYLPDDWLFNTTNNQSANGYINSNYQSVAGSGWNIPNEIEVYLLPKSAGSSALPGANFVAISQPLNHSKGTNSFVREVVLHELAHLFGLLHTFGDRYKCGPCPGYNSSGNCNNTCNDCPYFEDNTTVCDPPSVHINDCGSPIITNELNWFDNDNFSDTPENSNCGAGIMKFTGATNPDNINFLNTNQLWKIYHCDEPEEITNNLMDYGIGYALTQMQVDLMQAFGDGAFASYQIDGPEFNHIAGFGLPDIIECDIDFPITVDAGDGFNSYNWSTGGSNQTVQITESGDYWVSVTNDDGCTGYGSFTVMETQVTDIDPISSQTIEICDGFAASLSIPVEYLVDVSPASGVNCDDCNDLIFSPSVTTAYTIILTDANGCSRDYEYTFLVHPLPSITINNNDGGVCDGESITLIASGADSYQWDDANQTIGNTLVVTEVGTHTFSCVGTDANGCSASESIQVTIHPLPSITLNSDSPKCEGESVTLTASGADTYSWTGPESGSGSSFTVSTGGTYTCVGTDVNNCQSEPVDIEVVIHPLPTITLNSNGPKCEGESVTLTASGADTYSWTGPQSGSGSSFIVTMPGTYTCVGTENVNGCSASESIEVTFLSPPAEPSITTLIPSNAGCMVILLADDDGTISFQWSNTNTGELLGTDVTQDIFESGIYQLTVTDNVSGCSNNQIVTVPQVVYPSSPPIIDPQTTYTMDISNGGDRQIDGVITVPTGAELIIDNVTISFMTESSGIIVEKGGTLRVNGSTLQGNNCEARHWSGITVYGDHLLPQEKYYYTQGDPDHGIVLLENGSVVRDAYIGVWVPYMIDVIGSETAGGIVYTDGTSFENNRTAIRIDDFRAVQYSLIKESFFTNSAPFIGGSTAPYTHIRLAGNSGIKISNNLFETTTDSGLSDEERGTAIVCANAGAFVGTVSTVPPNRFVNTYKGVDIYSTNSIYSVPSVSYNEFDAVTKGVTISGSVGVRVFSNNFNVPAGTATHDTYGVMCFDAVGFEVRENYMETYNSPFNAHTRGLVVKTSTFEEANDATARDNHFSGHFAAATQVQGDNKGLNLNCNTYTGIPQNDWMLIDNTDSGGAPLGDLFLDEQGQCEDGFPDLSFSTHWHNNSTDPSYEDGWHIRNLSVSNFELVLNHDANSAPDPNFVEGLYGTQICINDDGFPVSNSCYEEVDDCPGCPELKNARDMVHEGDREGAVAFLEDINQKWADKILVPTYIDQGETVLAQNRLDMIPQLSTADQQFHAVWQAVIDGLESGSGKNNASEAALRYMAESRVKTPVHTYAESILAQYYGDTYTRSAVGWEKTGTDVMGLDNQLSIVPNPATNKVLINSEVLIENEVLGIYDASGKLILTQEWKSGYTLSINVRALESGVYFCRLKDQRISEKLVIIK